MSKVAIQGNASGTGTFTIAAPNSNTDRTLTLPDEAGTVLTSASSIPSSQITGSLGITMADQWYMDSDATGTVAPLLNWTRAIGGADSGGAIGSAMTEASGVFTFPATGIYYIRFQMRYYNSTSTDRAVDGAIATTTNNSTYTHASIGSSSIVVSGSTAVSSTSAVYIFDVQDTSTHKVRFESSTISASTIINGGTDRMRTGVQFIRLGDT